MEDAVTTATTTVFRTNRSQAVRLPKAVALPESIRQVEIVAIGKTRPITLAGESWDSWFDVSGVSDDFMLQPEQLDDQVREAL